MTIVGVYFWRKADIHIFNIVLLIAIQ